MMLDGGTVATAGSSGKSLFNDPLFEGHCNNDLLRRITGNNTALSCDETKTS